MDVKEEVHTLFTFCDGVLGPIGGVYQERRRCLDGVQNGCQAAPGALSGLPLVNGPPVGLLRLRNVPVCAQKPLLPVDKHAADTCTPKGTRA